MSDLGHVLVLAGGLSYEREVSLSSGRRVTDALAGLGVETSTRSYCRGYSKTRHPQFSLLYTELRAKTVACAMPSTSAACPTSEPLGRLHG